MIRSGVLCIDHGTKRTGFAVVDALRIAALPVDAFVGAGDGPELVAHIRSLLDERTIGTLLIGLPHNMDGTEGPRAGEVRAFAARLRERFPNLAVVLHDERLSTKEAEELMRDARIPPRDRKLKRDSLAALVVLRDWIAAGEPCTDAD